MSALGFPHRFNTLPGEVSQTRLEVIADEISELQGGISAMQRELETLKTERRKLMLALVPHLKLLVLP